MNDVLSTVNPVSLWLAWSCTIFSLWGSQIWFGIGEFFLSLNGGNRYKVLLAKLKAESILKWTTISLPWALVVIHFLGCQCIIATMHCVGTLLAYSIIVFKYDFVWGHWGDKLDIFESINLPTREASNIEYKEDQPTHNASQLQSADSK